MGNEYTGFLRGEEAAIGFREQACLHHEEHEIERKLRKPENGGLADVYPPGMEQRRVRFGSDPSLKLRIGDLQALRGCAGQIYDLFKQ